MKALGNIIVLIGLFYIIGTFMGDSSEQTDEHGGGTNVAQESSNNPTSDARSQNASSVAPNIFKRFTKQALICDSEANESHQYQQIIMIAKDGKEYPIRTLTKDYSAFDVSFEQADAEAVIIMSDTFRADGYRNMYVEDLTATQSEYDFGGRRGYDMETFMQWDDHYLAEFKIDRTDGSGFTMGSGSGGSFHGYNCRAGDLEKTIVSAQKYYDKIQDALESEYAKIKTKYDDLKADQL